MELNTLLEWVSSVSGSSDGKAYRPVRPMTAENTFLRFRIKSAWLVLTGKADAITWGDKP